MRLVSTLTHPAPVTNELREGVAGKGIGFVFPKSPQTLGPGAKLVCPRHRSCPGARKQRLLIPGCRLWNSWTHPLGFTRAQSRNTVTNQSKTPKVFL